MIQKLCILIQDFVEVSSGVCHCDSTNVRTAPSAALEMLTESKSDRLEKDGREASTPLQEIHAAVVRVQQTGLTAAPSRLFVGNVPYTFMENDLRTWFEEVSVSTLKGYHANFAPLASTLDNLTSSRS